MMTSSLLVSLTDQSYTKDSREYAYTYDSYETTILTLLFSITPSEKYSKQYFKLIALSKQGPTPYIHKSQLDFFYINWISLWNVREYLYLMEKKSFD